MADQPRGRGRGRAKSQEQDRQSTHHSGSQPLAGAWSRRPGPAVVHSGPSQTPYTRPPQPQQSQNNDRVDPSSHTVDRQERKRRQAWSRDRDAVDKRSGYAPPRVGVPGPSRDPVTPMDVSPCVGGGGDSASLGRGALRGRRIIMSELLKTRPSNLVSKKGSSGGPIMLQANYFKLLAMTDWCLYQYRVDFLPEEDRTAVRKGLLKLHKATLGAYIFDGTVLYTSARLSEKLELFSKRESDGSQIKINIRLVGDMVKGDHHYLQFFNIIMRKCLDLLQLQLVGRNYFDAKGKIEVRQFALELWPGYLTSIRQHEQDILMCAEITHKVMRQETLLDILNDCYHKSGDRYFKDEYMRRVIGAVVLTDYNNNTYRIDDVDFSVTPQSTFRLKSGDDISYADYYRNKYQIRIMNQQQPMLVVRTKPKERRAGQAELVYLVPELCRSTGITDDMRANMQLMRALASHTRVSPVSRIDKLIEFNRRLNREPKIKQELTEWNLDLDTKLVNVPGRVLPTENINFGNTRVSAGEFADWTRSFRNSSMIRSVPLQQWGLVCTDRVRGKIQQFVNDLIKVAGGMRFSIAPPVYCEVRDVRSSSYTERLESIMSKATPQLIFCVVPNNNADRYSAIKKKCCIDRPVPTQVFLEKNLTSKGLMSIATKVAIQMNCKLGGAPWCTDIPSKTLMVIGFDVCHDTDKKGQDFGAMVASLDGSLTKYFTAVSAHKNGEELSDELSTQICLALKKYRMHNENKLPERIIMYRDGVGEGQIPYVFEHEVERIKQQVGEVYKADGIQPKIAVIVVTKRVNTRLFYNKNNPPPGTVVDDVITNPMRYDFFIVSQSVHQGTVSPTAYSVISDTSNWAPDILQRLTYKLTHMYYNWSGTVRVPAPCQYAHKLAFLVAQSIHQPPSTQLDTLYFL